MANAIAISQQKRFVAGASISPTPSTSADPTPRSGVDSSEAADTIPAQKPPESLTSFSPEFTVPGSNCDELPSARKQTPGSIMSVDALVGHACGVPELKDALAEVDGLKSDIAGMEAVLTAVKGTLRFCDGLKSGPADMEAVLTAVKGTFPSRWL
jgi:hypothetical protein